MGDARGKHRPRGVMYVGNDTSTCELVHVTSKTAYVVANTAAPTLYEVTPNTKLNIIFEE